MKHSSLKESLIISYIILDFPLTYIFVTYNYRNYYLFCIGKMAELYDDSRRNHQIHKENQGRIGFCGEIINKITNCFNTT